MVKPVKKQGRPTLYRPMYAKALEEAKARETALLSGRAERLGLKFDEEEVT